MQASSAALHVKASGSPHTPRKSPAEHVVEERGASSWNTARASSQRPPRARESRALLRTRRRYFTPPFAPRPRCPPFTFSASWSSRGAMFWRPRLAHAARSTLDSRSARTESLERTLGDGRLKQEHPPIAVTKSKIMLRIQNYRSGSRRYDLRAERISRTIMT